MRWWKSLGDERLREWSREIWLGECGLGEPWLGELARRMARRLGFSENRDSENEVSENVDLRECVLETYSLRMCESLFMHANIQDLVFVVSELFNNNKSGGSREILGEQKVAV